MGLYAHLYSHLDVMEAAVAQTLLAAAADAPSPRTATLDLVPISPWSTLDGSCVPRKSMRLPGGGRALPVFVALKQGDDISSPDVLANLALLGQALRADSPGAPSTHREAVQAGQIWLDAEAKELSNHARNASWTSIPRSEVPNDRRIHKLIWVYKLKRDGSAKARLCVQGNTLQPGVDFDQTWSSALRYSSARALFAYAARKGCRVRSVDLVAAYLQGRFVDGEVVYCYLPTGYPELDSNGQPLIARVGSASRVPAISRRRAAPGGRGGRGSERLDATKGVYDGPNSCVPPGEYSAGEGVVGCDGGGKGAGGGEGVSSGTGASVLATLGSAPTASAHLGPHSRFRGCFLK